MGGYNINVPMDCGTPTAHLLAVKLLLNSIISTPGTRFLGLDLKVFYLNTHMERPEYLRMNVNIFPEDGIDQYSLQDKVDKNGLLYIWVECGMYKLPHT